MPVADMFWGDRYGQIEDPFGHRWGLLARGSAAKTVCVIASPAVEFMPSRPCWRVCKP